MVFFHPCLLTAVNAHIGKARNPWGEAGGGRGGARPWLDLGRRRVPSCSPVPLRFASLVLKEIVHPSDVAPSSPPLVGSCKEKFKAPLPLGLPAAALNQRQAQEEEVVPGEAVKLPLVARINQSTTVGPMPRHWATYSLSVRIYCSILTAG
jgi:hypothetical protein